MTDSEECSPFVASEASDASMVHKTAIGTGRQDSGPVNPSPVRVRGKVLWALEVLLVQPIKTWMRLERDASLLRGMDDRELQDIDINQIDIAAIRAQTPKRALSDDAKWILF